jgi:signal transduction histidine kinase
MSERARHPLEQLAHDIRNSSGLVAGALTEIRATLGASEAEYEVFLRIAGRGVRQLLLLADRCSVEGENARSGPPVAADGIELDEALQTAATQAREAFAKKSHRIEVSPVGEPVALAGSSRWIGVVLTEALLLALRSAAKTVRVTALTDGELATVAIENDGTSAATFPDDGTAASIAFLTLSRTLEAMGGSASGNTKTFRLLSFPLSTEPS